MEVTIRTITLGIGDAHPLRAEALARAAAFLGDAREAAEAAGYVVQTLRFATRPLLEVLADWADDDIEEYARTLQAACDELEVGYCSLGPVPADHPSFPLERIALLPRIVAPNAAPNATVHLATRPHGIRYAAALPTAEAVRRAAESSAGEANFRFAALAWCEPDGPFFPQAYTRGPGWTVSVGLQSAGLVERTIAACAERAGTATAALERLPEAVGGALRAAARPAVALVRRLATDAGHRFAGIDLSPAPMGEESIAAAIEAAGLGRFGPPRTPAVAAPPTPALKATRPANCGDFGQIRALSGDELLRADGTNG